MTLELWTVYDHPRDFPHCYVARKFTVPAPKDAPNPHAPFATDDFIVSPDLMSLREFLATKGLTPLARDPGDDPKIVETWV